MAETLDWAHALLSLGTTELNTESVDDTLGVILKYQEDVDRVRGDQASNRLSGRPVLQRSNRRASRRCHGRALDGRIC